VRFSPLTISFFVAVSVLMNYAQATCATNSATFPGRLTELKSPNGLYTIKNVDKPFGSGKTESHILYFLRTGQEKPLALNIHRLYESELTMGSYNRSVEVLWSPNSKAFALTDWAGSNIASAYLYRVNDLKHPTDFGDRLSRLVRSETDKNSTAKSDHFYTFASKWSSPTTLEIKESGHGPDEAFTLYYSWDLGTDSIKLTKKVAKEDLSSDVNP